MSLAVPTVVIGEVERCRGDLVSRRLDGLLIAAHSHVTVGRATDKPITAGACTAWSEDERAPNLTARASGVLATRHAREGNRADQQGREQHATEHGSPPVQGGGTMNLARQSQVREGGRAADVECNATQSVKLHRPLGMPASHAAVELAHTPRRIDPLGPYPPENIRDGNHQKADRNKCDHGALLDTCGTTIIHRQSQASAESVKVAG